MSIDRIEGAAFAVSRLSRDIPAQKNGGRGQW
ncbi:hypothetical protein PhaeoP128_02035 [Phaeobacter gallaeciensis]|nr:hypothetical protein PhaeoP129_02035 [Phaeobacter gallaeciensis]ATF22768.1 hypothetical protein PhaeoP128_02035 [Phaeobacter gallaeciensis]